MSKVSIHLVTWNGQKYIKECLKSVLSQTLTDYFLLIIDSGSIDDTVKIIEQEYLPVFGEKARFIKNKNNLGFAKTHNQALLWTDSEYVMILNQDVILDKDYLQKITEFIDKKPQAGSVTGKILRWEIEKNEQLTKPQNSVIIDSLGLKIFKNHRFVEIAAGEIDQGQFEEPKEIFGVSATCPIYRRQALNEIRYGDEFLDNDFFSYKEDVDLAYRLRWQGWQSFYLPQAIAYHERGAKSIEKASGLKIIKLRKDKNKFINYHSYKNHWFVLKKNLSTGIFWRTFIYIVPYEFVKFFYVLIFEWSTLAGLKEYFAKRKMMKRKKAIIMKKRKVKDEEIRKWLE